MKLGEFTRKDIEEKISTMGDYVKIGYLNNCLKGNLDFDARRFVLTNLSALYEERKMFADAGKMINFAAEINTTFNGKIHDYLKSVELFIKSGSYDDAELAVKKALSSANLSQKNEIKRRCKETYKSQVQEYLSKDKRKNAVEVYEILLKLDLDESEKRDIREKLLPLYERLGRVREFINLRKSLGK